MSHPAVNDQDDQPPPEDPIAYRIAVGTLGLAVVAFLIGAAVIASGGKPVPTQYWSAGGAIAGAVIGILAPAPQRVSPATPDGATKAKRVGARIWSAFVELWKNRAVFILMAVFGVSAAFAISRGSAELETVAAAAGGALVGLLAPSPSK
jgi:NADH:ubiquinone oxidoreductase subunit 6 (subunit J)